MTAGILPPTRHKCGKLKQPTKEQREEAERAKANAEKQHAAKQPHREGLPDPLGLVTREDVFLIFCLAHKIRSEWQDAGTKYRAAYSGWQLVKDSPGRTRQGGSAGDLDFDEALRKTVELGMAERSMRRAVGKELELVTSNMILMNVQPEEADSCRIKDALEALAIHFGTMPARR